VAETSIRILIVDDDPDLLDLLEQALQGEGYEVVTAAAGRPALRLFYQLEPDLVILDIMLPDMSGFELCARIREMADTPVLILSARGQEADVAHGLDVGADDYLSKPFSLAELLARVKAVLRRSGARPRRFVPRYVELGQGVGVDMAKRRVIFAGKPASTLSPTEAKLLEALLAEPDETIHYDDLFARVWGDEPVPEIDRRTRLKTYIHYLRRKIEQDPSNPKYIVTVRGLGYRLQRSEA
jgi:two-component system KDP operon response regulator KdpE